MSAGMDELKSALASPEVAVARKSDIHGLIEELVDGLRAEQGFRLRLAELVVCANEFFKEANESGSVRVETCRALLRVVEQLELELAAPAGDCPSAADQLERTLAAHASNALPSAHGEAILRQLNRVLREAEAQVDQLDRAEARQRVRDAVEQFHAVLRDSFQSEFQAGGCVSSATCAQLVAKLRSLESGLAEARAMCAKQCRVCRQPIVDAGSFYRLHAERGYVHAACFVCSHCRAPLERYVEHSDADAVQLLCPAHACHHDAAMVCAACRRPLRAGDGYLELESSKWHRACFACHACQQPVPSGQPVHLDGDHVTCSTCYQHK